MKQCAIHNQFFKWHLLTIFLLCCICAMAQVQTQLTADRILIGDTASLHITVTVNPDQQVKLAFPQDTLNRFVEVNDITIDTLRVGRNLNYIQKIVITAFEPGTFLVNSLSVSIDDSVYRTQALQITVEDMIVDEERQGMFPNKPIIPEDVTWWQKNKKYFWYFVVGALFLLAALLIVWLYIRELKRNRYVSNPLLPPYEEAINNLRKLDQQKYLTQEKYYEYYSDLSLILRRYFARRFDFAAQALLSSDLPDHMVRKDYLTETEAKELGEFLEKADLVKYARKLPDTEEHAKFREWVEYVINRTRPLTEEEVPDHY